MRLKQNILPLLKIFPPSTSTDVTSSDKMFIYTYLYLYLYNLYLYLYLYSLYLYSNICIWHVLFKRMTFVLRVTIFSQKHSLSTVETTNSSTLTLLGLVYIIGENRLTSEPLPCTFAILLFLSNPFFWAI